MRFVPHVLSILLASTVLCLGLGCKEEGPAEKAGKKVDETVEQAGQVMKEGAEKVEATADKAVEATKEGVEKVKKAAGKAKNAAK